MNRSIALSLWSCAALLAVTACHHGFTSTYGVRGLRLAEPVFPVVGMWLPDSTLRLSFLAPRKLRAADPLIRTIFIAVGSERGSYSDTVDVQVPLPDDAASKQPDEIFGEAYISGLRRQQSTPPFVDVSLVTGSDHVTFECPVTLVASVPVELRPFARSTADGTIDIGAEVRRIYTTTDEYLPSTEDVRVIISDTAGNTVWRSDAGLMFSTMIMKVEPQDRGSIAVVDRRWNGRDATGSPAPAGRYRADVIIPSIPQSYQASIEFQWSPQR